jgi:hypothetical protein
MNELAIGILIGACAFLGGQLGAAFWDRRNK